MLDIFLAIVTLTHASTGVLGLIYSINYIKIKFAHNLWIFTLIYTSIFLSNLLELYYILVEVILVHCGDGNKSGMG